MNKNREKLLVNFNEGEIIFEEHAPGNKLFVVQSGRVEICRTENGKVIHLAFLEPGSVFGEMSLIDGSLRSATGKAAVKTVCLCISRAMFRHKMATEVPTWMRSLFEVAIDWLRLTNIKASTRMKYVPGRCLPALQDWR